MANYIGVRCPVCNKRFVEGDDIVVCPVCGAPHHRACYQQLGHCALDELHIKGHVWEPDPPAQDSQDASGQSGAATCKCAVCGANNPADGLFCQVCGSPLKKASGGASGQPYAPDTHTSYPHGGFSVFYGTSDAQAPFAAAFGGVSPDEQIDGVSARDIALYVGPNSRYFLPRFKQLETHGGISVNLAAFFFTFLYCFYRKMYSVGLVLLGLFAVAQIPSLFIFPEYFQYVSANLNDIMIGITPAPFEPTQHLWAYAVIPFMRMFMIACGIVFSVLANRIYLRMVVKNVRALRQASTGSDGRIADDRQYAKLLAHRGSTSRAAVLVCVLGIAAAIFLVSNLMVAFLYANNLV